MDVTNVWVANDEGTEIVRARDIAGASLDHDGEVARSVPTGLLRPLTHSPAVAAVAPAGVRYAE